MAKSKGNRVQVILEGTDTKILVNLNFVTSQQNRKNTLDRMEIKKFNPIFKRYTVHKEIK